MKKKTDTHYLKIHIHDPCSEAWSGMRPEPSGRFCFQCEKIVRDFTQATDDELADFFRSAPGNVCGRFRSDQLSRPLPFRISAANPNVGKWRTAALISGLLLGGGMYGQEVIPPLQTLGTPTSTVTTMSESDNQRQTMPERLGEKLQVGGSVVDESGIPLVGVTVLLVGTNQGTITDIDGQFSLTIPTELKRFALQFSYVGYESETRTFKRQELDRNPELEVQMKVSTDLLGEVVVVAGRVAPMCVTYGSVVVVREEEEVPKPELVETPDPDLGLVVYPNPFVDHISLRFQVAEAGTYQVQLLDLTGHLIEQKDFDCAKGEQRFDPNFAWRPLPNATYLLRIAAPNGATWVKEIVKGR